MTITQILNRTKELFRAAGHFTAEKAQACFATFKRFLPEQWAARIDSQLESFVRLFPITLSQKAGLGLLATVVITGLLPLTGLLPPLLATLSQLTSGSLGLTAGIGLISGLLKIQNEERQPHNFDRVIRELGDCQANQHQDHEQGHDLNPDHENNNVDNALNSEPPSIITMRDVPPPEGERQTLLPASPRT